MAPVLSDYNLSTREVAARLGVHIDTVARWADQGRIPCARTPGGYRRFRPEDVEAFAATLLPEPESEASA